MNEKEEEGRQRRKKVLVGASTVGMSWSKGKTCSVSFCAYSYSGQCVQWGEFSLLTVFQADNSRDKIKIVL